MSTQPKAQLTLSWRLQRGQCSLDDSVNDATEESKDLRETDLPGLWLFLVSERSSGTHTVQDFQPRPACPRRWHKPDGHTPGEATCGFCAELCSRLRHVWGEEVQTTGPRVAQCRYSSKNHARRHEAVHLWCVSVTDAKLLRWRQWATQWKKLAPWVTDDNHTSVVWNPLPDHVLTLLRHILMLRAQPTAPLRVPESLWSHLFEVQKEGVRFCVAHQGRSLLADGMGLGKTMQAVALMSHYRAWPALVCVPKAALKQWEDVLNKWLPDVPVRSARRNPVPPPPMNGVMLLNPAQLTTSKWAKTYLPDLSDAGLGTLVVDESHVAKNHTATISRVLHALAANPSVRLALFMSGTPMDTHTHLWHQIRCLDGRFFPQLYPVDKHGRWKPPSRTDGTFYFAERYEDVQPRRVPRHNGRLVLEYHSQGPNRPTELYALLHELCLLRRKTTDHVDLPALWRVKRVVGQVEDDEAAYNMQKVTSGAGAGGEGKELKDSDFKTGSSFMARVRETAQFKLGYVYTYLRDELLPQLWQDPGLKVIIFGHHKAVTHRILQYVLQQHWNRTQAPVAAKDTGEPPSKKHKADKRCDASVDRHARVQCVLSVRDQRLLHERAQPKWQAADPAVGSVSVRPAAAASAVAEWTGYQPFAVLLDGSVSQPQREARMHAFQTHPLTRVAVLGSSMAAALNLTAASVGVFVELAYSPSTISQAEARYWRRLQTKPCKSVFLILEKSTDKAVWRIYDRKLQTALQILDGTSYRPELETVTKWLKPTETDIWLLEDLDASAINDKNGLLRGVTNAPTVSAFDASTLFHQTGQHK